jgi:formiminoglutamase
MTPDACDPGRFETLLGRAADLGDLPVTGDVEADQEALGAVVAALLDADVTPVLLGGGHETAYGHALGYLASRRAVHLLNWDAHADVRPLRAGRAHSGSPFRQALEHPSGLGRSYTVAGLHPWRVSAAHRAFVERHGRIVWAPDLSAERAEALAREAQAPTLASFDLDAVDGLPGVSAPGDGGVPVSVWLRAAEACGASAAVRSFDVVELNPAADPSGRSARLAALTVWHILRGLARRPADR